MRAEYLRYLLEIDRLHSISAAAQQLYLGQTALSAILKGAEEELGFQIFQRTHSGVTPTAEGEEALSLISEMYSRFQEVQNLNAGAAALSRPVPILTSPSIICGLALPVNRLFLDREPGGNLEFRVISGEEVGTRIIKNEANIGVTYYRQGDMEEYRAIASKYQISVDTLLHDHLYLVVRREHPLAGRRSVTLGELSGLHMALLPHYNIGDDTFVYTRFFGEGNQYTTFPNIPLIKRAVLSHNVCAILSGYAIRNDVSTAQDGLSAVLLADTDKENFINLCLIRRNDGNLRFLEKVAVKCIEEYFARLSSLPFTP